MSIVESLIRLTDPIAARAREEAREVTRALTKRDQAGPSPKFVCRVCGHRSSDGHFCPSCLAGTMERAR